MKNFCRQEAKNNQASLHCWTEFLKVIGTVESKQGANHKTPGSVDVSAVIDYPNLEAPLGGAGAEPSSVFAPPEVTPQGESTQQ